MSWPHLTRACFFDGLTVRFICADLVLGFVRMEVHCPHPVGSGVFVVYLSRSIGLSSREECVIPFSNRVDRSLLRAIRFSAEAGVAHHMERVAIESLRDLVSSDPSALSLLTDSFQRFVRGLLTERADAALGDAVRWGAPFDGFQSEVDKAVVREIMES